MDKAKMWAAIIGGACTSLIAVFGAESTLGKICAVLSAAATAVAVYAVPNVSAVPPAHASDKTLMGR